MQFKFEASKNPSECQHLVPAVANIEAQNIVNIRKRRGNEGDEVAEKLARTRTEFIELDV
jgi:hypothetical protein